MTRGRALFVGAVLVAISAGISAWAYPHAPAIVPTHWDAAGHANGYMPRFWGLAIWPILVAGLLLLMFVLPAISPRGFRIDAFANVYYTIVVTTAVVFVVLDAIAVRGSLGMSMEIGSAVFLPISLLFVVIGNSMGKFRKNFFIGVRTPWTLASDEVWLRTHRFAGHLFTLGGLVMIPISLFAGAASPAATGIWFGIAALLATVPLVYSYVVYRRIEGFKNDA